MLPVNPTFVQKLPSGIFALFLPCAFALTATLTIGATCASADTKQLVNEGVAQYKAGHMDKAVPLLVQALKEDGSNGPAHYYLGRALKQMGQNDQALKELDMAAKICPPAMLQALAEQAIAAHGNGTTGEQQKPEPGPFGLPSFASITSGFMGMFNNGNSSGGKTTTNGAQSAASAGADPFSSVRKSFKNVGGWFRKPEQSSYSSSSLSSRVAETIPMGQMVSLVNQGSNSKWRSNASGVIEFNQAPEFSNDWDQWIIRFKRAIYVLLLKHLAKDATTETGGHAGVIFSLDNQGHLRGSIYQSTADDTINDALLKTVKDLNGSAVLKFPSSTRITGWNFRMQWDFKALLNVVNNYRARQDAAALASSSSVAARMLTNNNAEAAATAKIKALPATDVHAKIAVAKPSVQVKTDVSAQIMPKPKPLELKAVPLKLSDLISGKMTMPGKKIDALGLNPEDEDKILSGESIDMQKPDELPADDMSRAAPSPESAGSSSTGAPPAGAPATPH